MSNSNNREKIRNEVISIPSKQIINEVTSQNYHKLIIPASFIGEVSTNVRDQISELIKEQMGDE